MRLLVIISGLAAVLIAAVMCHCAGIVSAGTGVDLPAHGPGTNASGAVDMVSFRLSAHPSDSDWPLEMIEAASIESGLSGAGVLVAVLDTGIDASHDELRGRVAAPVSMVEGCGTGDVQGHGTFVAGIIGAEDRDDAGTSGIAPGCRLLDIKVAGDTGKCECDDVIQGIYQAADHGAKVINISIEFPEYSIEMAEAVRYAWEKGVLVVAAAGNDGSGDPVYPAALANCLAVTSVDREGRLAPMANCGVWVDLAAPGCGIYSITPGNDYAERNGTSFAAAYASGLAALLFETVEDSNGNGRTNDEVLDIMLSSCKRLGDEGTGRGLINVRRSLELASLR